MRDSLLEAPSDAIVDRSGESRYFNCTASRRPEPYATADSAVIRIGASDGVIAVTPDMRAQAGRHVLSRAAS